MTRSSYLFTSESVSEGHPDKVCDRISDTIVDIYLGADPQARVAVETLCTTNQVVLAGEVRGPASITHDKLKEATRAAIKDIGYEQEGFHWQKADIECYVHSQSADIARGEEFVVTTTEVTAGSRSSSIVRTSLSARQATTATRWVNAKPSDSAATVAAMPCGLCAASTITVGEDRTTSSRPGDDTEAKPARTVSASSPPAPKNASTHARATAAFCAWCGPCSWRDSACESYV